MQNYRNIIMLKITRTAPSEATIQAELYCALKSAGLRPILEQNVRLDLVPLKGTCDRTIRIDVLLVNERDFAFAAVEVKTLELEDARPNYAGTRQFNKYRRLGLPFRYCMTLAEIAATVEWAKDQAAAQSDSFEVQPPSHVVMEFAEDLRA